VRSLTRCLLVYIFAGSALAAASPAQDFARNYITPLLKGREPYYLLQYRDNSLVLTSRVSAKVLGQYTITFEPGAVAPTSAPPLTLNPAILAGVRVIQMTANVTLSPNYSGDGQALVRSLLRSDFLLHPMMTPPGQPQSTAPLQKDVIRQLQEYVKEADANNTGARGLVILPPGIGKTVITGEFLDELSKQKSDYKIFFIVQNREILDQAASSLQRQLRIPPAKVRRVYGESSREPLFENGAKLITTTRTTFYRNLESFFIERERFKGPVYYVIDEAHHAGKVDGEFDEILKKIDLYLNRGDVLLGLTATPWHTDSDLIERIFHNHVATAFLSDEEKQQFLDQRKLIYMSRLMLFRAMAQGYLSPIQRYRQVRYLEGDVPVLARDFLDDWEKKFENLSTEERYELIQKEIKIHRPLVKKMIQEIVSVMRRDANGKLLTFNRGIIFVPSIAHADVYSFLINQMSPGGDQKIEARAFHSGMKSDLRDQTMDWFRDEEKTESTQKRVSVQDQVKLPVHKYLVAIRTIGEGYDEPRTNHIILAKPYSEEDMVGMRELLQNIGRASRLAYAKPDFSVSDFTGDMRRLIFEGMDAELINAFFTQGGEQDFEPLPPRHKIERVPVVDDDTLKDAGFEAEAIDIPESRAHATPSVASSEPSKKLRPPPPPNLDHLKLSMTSPIDSKLYIREPGTFRLVLAEVINDIEQSSYNRKEESYDDARKRTERERAELERAIKALDSFAPKASLYEAVSTDLLSRFPEADNSQFQRALTRARFFVEAVEGGAQYPIYGAHLYMFPRSRYGGVDYTNLSNDIADVNARLGMALPVNDRNISWEHVQNALGDVREFHSFSFDELPSAREHNYMSVSQALLAGLGGDIRRSLVLYAVESPRTKTTDLADVLVYNYLVQQIYSYNDRFYRAGQIMRAYGWVPGRLTHSRLYQLLVEAFASGLLESPTQMPGDLEARKTRLENLDPIFKEMIDANDPAAWTAFFDRHPALVDYTPGTNPWLRTLTWREFFNTPGSAAQILQEASAMGFKEWNSYSLTQILSLSNSEFLENKNWPRVLESLDNVLARYNLKRDAAVLHPAFPSWRPARELKSAQNTELDEPSPFILANVAATASTEIRTSIARLYHFQPDIPVPRSRVIPNLQDELNKKLTPEVVQPSSDHGLTRITPLFVPITWRQFFENKGWFDAILMGRSETSQFRRFFFRLDRAIAEILSSVVTTDEPWGEKREETLENLMYEERLAGLPRWSGIAGLSPYAPAQLLRLPIQYLVLTNAEAFAPRKAVSLYDPEDSLQKSIPILQMLYRSTPRERAFLVETLNKQLGLQMPLHLTDGEIQRIEQYLTSTPFIEPRVALSNYRELDDPRVSLGDMLVSNQIFLKVFGDRPGAREVEQMLEQEHLIPADYFYNHSTQSRSHTASTGGGPNVPPTDPQLFDVILKGSNWTSDRLGYQRFGEALRRAYQRGIFRDRSVAKIYEYDEIFRTQLDPHRPRSWDRTLTQCEKLLSRRERVRHESSHSRRGL